MKYRGYNSGTIDKNKLQPLYVSAEDPLVRVFLSQCQDCEILEYLD